MNKKLPLILPAAVLLGALSFAPVSRAADQPAARPKHEKKVGPRVLKKYDQNHNGMLDPDEKAAWEADKARRRAERKTKKAAGKTGDEKPVPGDDGGSQ